MPRKRPPPPKHKGKPGKPRPPQGWKGGNNPMGEDDGVRTNRPPTLDEQLLEAADEHRPDLNKVQRLIAAGAEVSATGWNGRSVLHNAVYHGDEKLVEFLLRKNANPNAESLSGTRPLHEIIEIYPPSQAPQIARLLKSFGANPSLKDEGGFTPLFAAVEHGRADLIPVLVEIGADLNAKDDQNWPLLTYAASRGRTAVVQDLLNRGLNPKLKGGRYGNALQAAAVHGRVGVVKLLLARGVNPNAPGGQYEHALQAAAFKGKERVVRLLVKAGARIEWPEDDENEYEYPSAIDIAARAEHYEVAEWLKQWKEGKVTTIEFHPKQMTLGTMTVTRRAKSYDSDDTGDSSADEDGKDE